LDEARDEKLIVGGWLNLGRKKREIKCKKINEKKKIVKKIFL